MNKKGFTLIELLAVIVILAVIALIATPAVLNIIEDSKESAAKDSAMAIAKSAETYYVSNATLLGKEVGTIDLTTGELQYKGEKPEKGYVTFDDKGNSYLKMYMNGYCIVSDYDNTVVSEKMDSDECTMSNDGEVEVPELGMFLDGDEVYFNPVTNAACRDTDYVATNSAAGYVGTVDSGCMKWYAFLSSDEATTIKLLLDHNVTLDGEAFSKSLSTFIGGWDSEVAANTRRLRAAEVHEIAQRNGTAYDGWDVTDWTSKYYFTTGSTEYDSTPVTEPSVLGWIFDNLSYCADRGCYNEDSAAEYSYWLEEEDGGSQGWLVGNSGSLSNTSQGLSNGPGLRPVIEVPRTKLVNE